MDRATSAIPTMTMTSLGTMRRSPPAPIRSIPIAMTTVSTTASKTAAGRTLSQVDTDADARSDLAEATAGTNPSDPDTDHDGVDDSADDCRVENAGEHDRDHDGVGDSCDLSDAYATWQLIGITSNVASTPASLFALDTADAFGDFLMSLDNGDEYHEVIAFNPGNRLLYHAAESVWESIDVEELAVVGLSVVHSRTGDGHDTRRHDREIPLRRALGASSSAT